MEGYYGLRLDGGAFTFLLYTRRGSRVRKGGVMSRSWLPAHVTPLRDYTPLSLVDDAPRLANQNARTFL
jgi:hypothetical protein